MKINIFLLLCLASFQASAARDERQLIKCLGAEEKAFHLKKQSGPLYDLNQRIISEMLQIPHAELTNTHFNEICGKSTFSSALKLLELSISNGKDIFDVPSDITGSQKMMAQGMISDYLEATREIFINFITQIQSSAPSPTCLKEEIPELDTFFTDIKYLQEDVEIKKIFAGRDIKIFQKIKDYNQAFERCRARIKKKLNSESKPAAKKS